jgi:hypothetical protein
MTSWATISKLHVMNELQEHAPIILRAYYGFIRSMAMLTSFQQHVVNIAKHSAASCPIVESNSLAKLTRLNVLIRISMSNAEIIYNMLLYDTTLCCADVTTCCKSITQNFMLTFDIAC